jgi:hypothetical protein
MMTGGRITKKPPEISGGLDVSCEHDWSRPPQLPHHQIAMFFDVVFMGEIVSGNKPAWQADLRAVPEPDHPLARCRFRATICATGGDRPTCFIVSSFWQRHRC